MKLKDYLKLRKIRQEAFAKDLGVTQGSVSRWCDGIQLPRASVMKKILVITGGEVTLMDFYNNMGEN